MEGDSEPAKIHRFLVAPLERRDSRIDGVGTRNQFQNESQVIDMPSKRPNLLERVLDPTERIDVPGPRVLAARENFPLLACENVPLGEAGLLACARRGS